MNRLINKAIIITGANSGVGRAAAILFAQEGAKLMLCARREEKLKEVAEEIAANGGNVKIIQADISKPTDAKRVTAACIKEYGAIDVLINNAGVNSSRMCSIDKCTDDAELDRIININFKGTFYMIREALSYMLPAGAGAIVNTASVAGVTGVGDGRYAASKGAVIALTRHTAVMHTGHGIRCNAICPAAILTPMILGSPKGSNMDEETGETMRRHADSTVAANKAEDVAATLMFLASDESKNITGQAIVCDFGYSL